MQNLTEYETVSGGENAAQPSSTAQMRLITWMLKNDTFQFSHILTTSVPPFCSADFQRNVSFCFLNNIISFSKFVVVCQSQINQLVEVDKVKKKIIGKNLSKQ